MKTKIIPFNAEMAKDIQDGKIKGKIKTRSGFPARIICYDADGYGVKMLIVLVRREEPKESCSWYYKNGKLSPEPESRLPHRDDLVLEVPDDNEPQFKPFDKVLVRDYEGGEWIPAFFGFYTGIGGSRYRAVGGSFWRQCIPYAGNENLVGTTDKPNEE